MLKPDTSRILDTFGSRTQPSTCEKLDSQHRSLLLITGRSTQYGWHLRAPTDTIITS
jgi:hypothetical protein